MCISHTLALISHATKVISPIKSSTVTWTVKFHTFKLDLEKAEEPEIKLSTFTGSYKKQENCRKTTTSASSTVWKSLTVWIKTNCGKLTDTGIADHHICLLRNLYAGQEATARSEHGKTAWLQIRKGVYQGCILSPWLLNLYTEYIMRNVQLVEAQTGIKISGRNINNLRYADDTTLMAESEEELKSLLMKVKEESETSGLNSPFRKRIWWHLVKSLHGN